jgi:protein involved in ribonucleotide reduction
MAFAQQIQTSKSKLFDPQQKKLDKHNKHLKVENTTIEIKVQNPYMHFTMMHSQANQFKYKNMNTLIFIMLPLLCLQLIAVIVGSGNAFFAMIASSD